MEHQKQVLQVITALQDAFGQDDVLPNPKDILVGETYLLKEWDFTHEFAGLRWQDVPGDTVLRYREQIGYFDDVGFWYFLPAFAIISLGDTRECDLLKQQLVFELDSRIGDKDGTDLENVRRLTDVQRIAIVRYLEFLKKGYTCDLSVIEKRCVNNALRNLQPRRM